MELEITSLKELSAHIMPYRKRGVMTNAFVSPEAYAAEIAEKRLFVRKSEGFLGIFVRRDDFCSLYYYALGGKADYPALPLICETVGELAEPLASDFSPLLSRVRLTRPPSEQSEESGASSVRCVKREEAEYGFRLLSACFDRHTAALPTLTEFLADCENGRVIGYFENAAPVGLLRFSASAKRAEIRHLCVSETYRKKGIAAALCRRFLSRNGEKTVSVFTGSENRAALTLYGSFGFCPDGTTSVVYQKGVLL